MTDHVFFGLGLTLLLYAFGLYLQRRLRRVWANPILWSSALIITLLLALRIPLADYRKSADFLLLFIGPSTAALSVNIYHQRALLKRYWLPVVGGSGFASLCSLLAVHFLGRALGMDERLILSLYPKSVTTAIALPLSEAYAGVQSLTLLAVMVSGLIGAIVGPLLFRLFKSRPLAQGIALGANSHALGTIKALELGELQGAMGGIAIALTGLFTVLWMAILF